MEDKWNPNEPELESEELLDAEDSPEVEGDVMDYTEEEPDNSYEGELLSEEPEEEPEPPKPKPKKNRSRKNSGEQSGVSLNCRF